MDGFGPFLRPFLWFKLYWAAWAVVLAVVARLFWVRGREPGLRRRFGEARARLRGRTLNVAGAGAALAASLGGFVFYNTDVLNDGRIESGRRQAEYERRYRRFVDTPQPMLTAVNLRTDIYPDAPAVDMRGTYRLVNRTGVAVESVHVATDRAITVRSMSVDREARPVLVDDEAGYRILALARPLAPGDSIQLSFDVAYRPRGFRSWKIPTSVVANGSYFDRGWLPFIGYQPAFEHTDPAPRRRFGLPPRRERVADDSAALRRDNPVRNEAPEIRLEAVVSTPANQMLAFSGAPRRTWIENGRRYVQYGFDVPTRFGGSVVSARYAVREDRWKNVVLQVLYHPPHAYNLDRMVSGMKAALDYYSTTFGPYQFGQLRIAEIPPYSINARALATTILFSEQNFITHSEPGQVDHTFFGTAHEVAHSWWGAQVRPADTKGRGFLSEGLSNYSAMMVTEHVLGAEQARRVYDFQLDRYLRRRGEFAVDVPLVDVGDQPHIAYGKGAVAMYMMRDMLGAEVVNGALRRFIEQHRVSGPPYPTARDLVATLEDVTPDSLQYLITDLFETITLWDVQTTRATVARKSATEYEVTLDVTARKVRADNVGREAEVPMNDLVEIGVFAPAGRGEAFGEALYLARQRVRDGNQTIRVTVHKAPARAGVDPYHKLLDRDASNNLVTVR
jgi:hypothetical protein